MQTSAGQAAWARMAATATTARAGWRAGRTRATAGWVATAAATAACRPASAAATAPAPCADPPSHKHTRQRCVSAVRLLPPPVPSPPCTGADPDHACAPRTAQCHALHMDCGRCKPALFTHPPAPCVVASRASSSTAKGCGCRVQRTRLDLASNGNASIHAENKGVG